MSDRLEQKLEKLDERVDRIDVTMARVDERLQRLQLTLDKHDAKTAIAIDKAELANIRIDNIWVKLLKDLRWAALLVTGIGGAIYFLVDKLGG